MFGVRGFFNAYVSKDIGEFGAYKAASESEVKTIDGKEKRYYTIGKDPLNGESYIIQNVRRGQERVQQEKSNIAVSSVVSAAVGYLLMSKLKISPMKKWPVEFAVSAIGSYLYGYYKGSKPGIKISSEEDI